MTEFRFLGVAVDRCGCCGGCWLDRGEPEAITEAARPATSTAAFSTARVVVRARRALALAAALRGLGERAARVGGVASRGAARVVLIGAAVVGLAVLAAVAAVIAGMTSPVLAGIATVGCLVVAVWPTSPLGRRQRARTALEGPVATLAALCPAMLVARMVERGTPEATSAWASLGPPDRQALFALVAAGCAVAAAASWVRRGGSWQRRAAAWVVTLGGLGLVITEYPRLQRTHWSARELHEFDPTGELEGLRARLASPDEEARRAVVAHLGYLHVERTATPPPTRSDERAVALLLEAMIRDPSPRVQREARDEVAQSSAYRNYPITAQHAPLLVEALGAPLLAARMTAAYALASLDTVPDEALPPLVHLLAEGDDAARQGALRAITRLGPRGAAALPAVVETLRRPADRHAAIAALRAMQADPARLRPVYEDLANSGEKELAITGACGLATLGAAAEPALATLGSLLERGIALSCVADALAGIGPPARAWVGALLARVDAQNGYDVAAQAALRAVSALGGAAGDELAPALAVYFAEPMGPYAAGAALDALVAIRAADAVVIPLAERALVFDRASQDTVAKALRVLARAAPASRSALPAVVALLERTGDAYLTGRAVEALVEMDPERSPPTRRALEQVAARLGRSPLGARARQALSGTP